MTQEKTSPKYQYIISFIFGMVIMVVIYVLFDLSTNAENRTRTSVSAGDTTATSGVVLTAGPSSNITKTAGSSDSTEPSVFLGVELMDLNDIMAEQLGIRNAKGVLVNSVVLRSPAAAAGLKRGDVITFMNNRAVLDIESFTKILSNIDAGDRVRLVYVRNQEKASTYAVVTALPQTPTTAVSSGTAVDWGVSLAPLNPTLRSSLNIPDDISGVAILSVLPGGLADRSGLQAGDVIVAIDKSPIENLDDFFSAIAKDTNTTALLSVYSQGNLRYVPLDSAMITTADQVQSQTQSTLRDKIFAVFAGGMPFASATDDTTDDEEGPKGGKFADSSVTLTADTTQAFNRPSSPPIETSTTGSSSTGASSSSSIALNRPSQVPPQSATTNDTVLFVGILLVIILYLAYREFHRPPEIESTDLKK